ncbi:MAG: leucine--tRNA ligase [Candidatus Thermoplasmatota archaeon]|nr:leucine--tRNA ligase [Candidatus Thermoplasmatota archaeon]
MVDFTAIEKKWQERWFKAGLYKAKKDGKKFFIHFAYPGISGYLHVGHMRGFAYADIIARYKRMTGYSVCFPAGFHASGLPTVSLAKKVARKESGMLKYLRDNRCPDDVIKKLSDPEEVVRYFSKVYVEDYWKPFGFFIDYSRLMDTISPGYKKFIEWQFHKLKDKGLLIQKPHFAPFCPNCGPVAVDKSETDISEGGDAEILEFTVIKFQMDDMILPAATLRPETIFGVTNMWINPDEEYVITMVGNEKWILSEQGSQKISNQMNKEVEAIGTVSGKELVGKKCTVPVVERKVPILPATFADPNVATGIVMSVPAHAPYDYIALKDLQSDIEPIVIISVRGHTIPAKEVVEKMGIKNQNEEDALEKATQEVYKEEFHKGTLNESCGEYAGIKISEIKDSVKNMLIEEGKASIMREFSKRVVCRCGNEVIIKIVPDQWFIRYSDEELTGMSKEHAASMDIYPEEYKQELPKVLDWFKDRACIRQGSWLGTEFPFKKEWIIEPISDSALYPAYYVISKYVNERRLKTDDMDNEFFDYVFLGRGKEKNSMWKEIRDDFLYWYPVDINLGGKEHKTVHFPVFIMNHVAIMEAEHWPKGIFVNWWIIQKSGEKISKSKGGAVPIPDAATLYGIDAMRLYYAHIGSPYVDVEWDNNKVENYRSRLAKLWNMHDHLLGIQKEEESSIDDWLEAMLNQKIRDIKRAMENYELRKAANIIFFDIYNTFQWYMERGGKNSRVVKKLMGDWIKMMCPFTPHIAEEMWENLGKEGFVSEDLFPEEKPVNEEVLRSEQLLIKTVEDIKEILDVTKIKPSKIFIYTSPSWKWTVAEKATELAENKKLDMGTLMKELMSNKDIKSYAKHVPRFAQKIIKDVSRGNKFARVDETGYLKNAKGFLRKELNAEVEIFSADDDVPDPGNKKAKAEPLRPAIYAE